MEEICNFNSFYPDQEMQNGLIALDEFIPEANNSDLEDGNLKLIPPLKLVITYEETAEHPEPEGSKKLSLLENVIWEDVNTVHPMLDFKNGAAYVAVNMDFNAGSFVESYPFTICSDGSYFETNNVSELAKRGLRYSRPLLAAPSRWKKSYLKEYLEGKADIDLVKLFTEIRNQFARYVRFEEKSTYSFMALWTIGTYLHPIFDAFPMVLLCGPKGSGKTRTLQVATLLAFNARLQGDPTPATLFRIIDEERPTLLFDEMEWLARKELQCALSSILKFGYKPGCKVPRCRFDAKGNPNGVTSFDSYCPKMFANIHGLEDVLGDRTITFIQRRKTAADNIEVKDPSESNPVWAMLRHELYVFMLTHGQSVKEFIPTDSMPVSNRDLELFSAVLGLARFFEDKAGIESLYAEMIQLASNKAAERKESDKELSHDAILIQALLNLALEEDWYSIAAVIKEFKKFFMGNSDWINDVWAGRALNRLGIGKAEGTKERKWGRDENNKPTYLTHYFITRHEVELLAERYGIEFRPQNTVKENNPFLTGHIRTS
jgi:hypothetical protein